MAQWPARASRFSTLWTFPELGEIILNRWTDFEHLLGDKAWVERYFDDMNKSRRAIGHTGDLSEHAVERMEPLRPRDGPGCGKRSGVRLAARARPRQESFRSNRASRHDPGYTELALDLVRLTVATSSFRSTRVLV